MEYFRHYHQYYYFNQMKENWYDCYEEKEENDNGDHILVMKVFLYFLFKDQHIYND